jgi:uncharacterized integral membrane protein (TIGR00697 family)
MAAILQNLRTTYSERQNYKYLDILGMFYVTALLVSTFAACKLVSFGSVALPGTIIVYSVTYILSDIFTEVYGYKAARRIIWTGMILLIFANIILYIISVLPAAPEYKDQESFAKIFQGAPLYTLATIASYLSGEFVNSYTMAKLKIWMNGKFLWIRTVGSTMFGTAVDFTVYTLIAYGFVMSLGDAAKMIAIGWLICVAYEALATPITYKIINFLKRAEGVDIYDRGTDFNPFHVMQTPKNYKPFSVRE